MRQFTSFILIFMTLGVLSCKKQDQLSKDNAKLPDADKALTSAARQLSLQLEDAERAGRIPRTLTPEGTMHWARESFDWTEGFFPGSCWYLYEFTGDEKWRTAAERFQAMFESHKLKTDNHDLGFIFNCSFGNGYRLTENDEFKEVMITAGDSLLTRFNPVIGCIKSWDVDGGWQKGRHWKFPVIVDNMMNLELLFKLSEMTGDPKYREVAIIHANTTLKNHFREDNSSYHVVDYDPDTGAVRSKETAQGFANESAWARGQAWGLYGYTICYRFTRDQTYLDQAVKIADFILNNPSLPEDGVPYWDHNAPKIPDEPRDASASAITVSALLELNGYTDNSYESSIIKILSSLGSDVYSLKPGQKMNFVLDHSVGSIPHEVEIDVPINYADYYYIEALMRYRAKNSQP